jgi:translocation and assembly module TamB
VGVVRRTLAISGAGIVFLLASMGGLVLHRNVGSVRRALATRLNAALASVLPGRIVVERIGGLGLESARGLDVTLEDPSGHAAVRLTGVTARVDLGALVRSLEGTGPVAIDLRPLSADLIDVDLDLGADGRPRVVEALVSATPAPESPPGRGVTLSIPDLRLARVSVHGNGVAPFPIDADLDGVALDVEVTPGAVTVDLGHAALTARGTPPGATTTGTLVASYAQPSTTGATRAASLRCSGQVGAIDTTASVLLDGSVVVATVDAPVVKPADLRVLWPESPLQDPSSVHVDVAGRLPLVIVTARATAGPGTVDARALLDVGDTRRAAVHVETDALDIHAAIAGAPTSNLGAVADGVLLQAPDQSLGGVFAATVRGNVGPTVVPSTTVSGDFSRAAPPSQTVQGHLHAQIREAGAPSTVDATITPLGKAYQVAFDADVRVPDLDRVVRVGPLARGSARLSAHGRLDTGTQQVDATLAARADGVSAGSVSLGRLRLDARATGPVASPRLDGDVHGEDLEIAGQHIARLHAGLHGPASGADVSLRLGDREEHLKADATVAVTGAGASVRDLRVDAERGGQDVRLEAPHVILTAREQRLEDALVRGLGAPLHVTVLATPAGVKVQTHSHSIDLARVARLAGASAPIEGRVALDVDATLRRTDGEGHFGLDVTGATVGLVQDAEAHVDLTLAGRRISGSVNARVGDVGTASLQTTGLDVEGKGALLSSSSSVAGAVDADGHVDLARLAQELGVIVALPFSRVAGAVDLHAHVERAAGTGEGLALQASAKTSGLTATGPTQTPWTLAGVDGQAELSFDPATHRTALTVQATDAAGVLVSADLASTDVPYGRLSARTEPWTSVLRGVPMTGTVTIPGRELSALPAFFGTRNVHGQLHADVAWDGPLDHPTVDLNASLARAGPGGNALAVPLDLAVRSHYDGAVLTTSLQASARSKPLLDASAEVDAKIADVLARLSAGAGTIPWTASGRATLTRFPLQSVAALDDRQVRGHVSGQMTLAGLHQDASANASLTSDDLVIGDVTCEAVSISATLDKSALVGDARIQQTDGALSAHLQAGSRWGASVAPSLDATQPADAIVSAQSFRVEFLQPLVESVLSELDGRVQGDVRVHVDPAKRLFQPQGMILLTGGVIEVADLGGEFHDARAEIDLTPDGVIRLQNASATGLSGKLEAAASARFAGVAFAGARASLQVNHQQPLPLVLDGVQVGTFDGQLQVAVDPGTAAQGGGYDVKVDVPTMQLQLPDTTTRSVEKLGTMDGVQVGLQRAGQAFAPVALDGPTQAATTAGRAQSPIHLTVALGKDVLVKKGTMLSVNLTGAPSIVVTDDVRASGQVRLVNGSLDVQGKKFTIDTGTVTFVDDPTNPQVVLSASWPAPDGTTIIANFVGPLKTGKVTLTSDPPRPQNEILSLLLFGTTDEQAPTASGSTAQGSSAVGAAGGAATAPINQALGGVNQMLDNFGLAGGISTRVDTSQATPRPEVEVQIARDLSVQVAWVLGVPPPGSNPDSTLFTLDWRFLRSWSLDTTVGDAGTTILDLIWQHRY